MTKRRWFTAAACTVLSASCFHQVVQTGKPAGPTVIDKPWVATWVFGLVAAEEIDVRKECPSGAAIIETEQSFVNSLVGIVTIGIFTPQHVRITCAAGGTASLPRGASELRLAADATVEQSAAVMDRAIEIARHTNEPVMIRVDNTLRGDNR